MLYVSFMKELMYGMLILCCKCSVARSVRELLTLEILFKCLRLGEVEATKPICGLISKYLCFFIRVFFFVFVSVFVLFFA